MLKYRPDVDGLRTLAVVPVVLFHAGLPFLQGGFVGVDVFFVISGFLITGLILKDLDGAGFSIGDFYRRRVRRIFPALTVVLLFCLLVGIVILPPLELRRLGLGVIYATLSVSNVYFWKSTDYFSPKADGEALLHTWSLSVEEQFYVVYPLALLFLHKRRWPLLPILATLAALSLAAASTLVFIKPSGTFYLLPTRAWELLLGGMVALPAVRRAGSESARAWAAAIGLGMIVLPVLTYGPAVPFPGPAALPPTLGTALVIWSGLAGPTRVHRLLAARPMVAVGRASYSLYLWHFPLLVFARYLWGGRLPLVPALAASAVALVAAFASLRFVERPFRARAASPKVRSFQIGAPVAGMVALGLVSALLVIGDGWPRRLGAAEATLLAVQEDERRHHLECMSVGDVLVTPDRACRLGDARATAQVVLWGDSHAMVTATAMEAAARESRAAFLFAAAADCPVGLGFGISDATEPGLTSIPAYRYCRAYNRAMYERVVGDPSLRTVVLSSRWSNWRVGAPHNPTESFADLRLEDDRGPARSVAGNRAIFERGFRLLLDRLTAAGKRVYIVGPLPEPEQNVPNALYVQRFGIAPAPSTPTMDRYRLRHAAVLPILQAASTLPQISLLWPVEMLCRDGICPLVHEGIPVFFDHNHLSADAARRTAPLYRPIFASQRPVPAQPVLRPEGPAFAARVAASRPAPASPASCGRSASIGLLGVAAPACPSASPDRGPPAPAPIIPPPPGASSILSSSTTAATPASSRS